MRVGEREVVLRVRRDRGAENTPSIERTPQDVHVLWHLALCLQHRMRTFNINPANSHQPQKIDPFASPPPIIHPPPTTPLLKPLMHQKETTL